MDVRVDEVGGPAEILRLDVLGRKADLDAVRFHLRDVAVFGDLAADALGRDRADQVEVVAFVPVEGQVDPVVDEPDVESEVQLVLLLVGELCIFEARNLETGFGIAAGRTPRGRGFDDGQRVGDVRRAAVGGQRVGGFERQVRQGGLYMIGRISPRGRSTPRRYSMSAASGLCGSYPSCWSLRSGRFR